MKKGIFRKILGGLGFTTALFIFQACYGTPQDMYQDLLVEGKVSDRDSGQPLSGILVIDLDMGQYQFTDASGVFSFYTLYRENLSLRFEDADSLENGYFPVKDTVLSMGTDYQFLDIRLSRSDK